MNRNRIRLFVLTFLIAHASLFVFAQNVAINDSLFITHIINPQKQSLQFYWKNDKGEIFKSIQNLQWWLNKNNQKLLFAMNGGMYKKDNSPQGLFIDKKTVVMALDTTNGNGNFYLKPNGVFYITTNNIAAVCTTEKFANNGNIKYATQSGPMLVIDGNIHPAFKDGSTNLNIRNGVGILPDNQVVFVMSKKEINFYDFSNYFKGLGCKNALYLDGLVSRTYLPAKNWVQMDGNFGVIIGVAVEFKK